MSPRPTPFALGLPGEGWADETFAALVAEAGSRGTDPSEPGGFLLLARVGAALQDLRREEDASPEAFHAFGLFLFHAFHLLGGVFEAPGLLLEVTEEVAERLVQGDAEGEPGPGEERAPPLPAPAGYLQLPRHRFWTRPGGEEAPAEALDGVAWTRTRGPGGDARLAVLAVTGVVEDRAGFSVLPLPPVPLADAGSWARARGREEGEGEDFASTLPGGELAGFYSVETAGELLKLVARAFLHADAIAGRNASPGPDSPGPDSPDPDSPDSDRPESPSPEPASPKPVSPEPGSSKPAPPGGAAGAPGEGGLDRRLRHLRLGG